MMDVQGNTWIFPLKSEKQGRKTAAAEKEILGEQHRSQNGRQQPQPCDAPRGKFPTRSTQKAF